MPTLEQQDRFLILHLGESHCLTFAHQRILVKGKQLVIKPSLVKGAKAFHLSEETRANLQKIGFKSVYTRTWTLRTYISLLEKLTAEKMGIILHCEKTGNNIEDIARETAKKYFQGTRKLLSKYKTKLVYFGTPAPFRADLNSGEITAKNKNRLLVIKVFNTTLKEQCQRSGTPFVDVYNLTAGEDGYNNNEWNQRYPSEAKAIGELIARLHRKYCTIQILDLFLTQPSCLD